MKNSKKKWYIVIGIIVAVIVAAVIYFCIAYLPKIRVGKEIADLLHPILTEENQSVHLDVSADLAGELVDFHSDMYFVEEEEIKYIVMEQYDFPIYIVDNVLFLENGHAFKLVEEAEEQTESQTQVVKYEELFVQIAAVYELFDITCAKTDYETGYSVTVTGEQVQEILQVAMPSTQETKNEVLNSIQNLHVELVARQEKLDRIVISGNADVNNSAVQIEIALSEFRVLSEGEYVIPDIIKDAMKTVDKDTLFSLTEDLYRLIVAFEQFSKQETTNGTVSLHANCGIIDFHQTYDLKDFENLKNENAAGNGTVDTDGVQKLPEMIGFLCMEGEITSKEIENAHEYTLLLDEESMQKIAQMVVPELINYVVSFTEGTVVVILEDDTISTIKIEIDGNVHVLFSDVPAVVGIEFRY